MSVKHGSKLLSLELAATLALCESIGSVRALTVSLLVKHNEFDQLLDLSIDADRYDDYRSFSDDHLVTSVLSKNPRLPSSHEKREAAIGKFYAAEALCADTNIRIRQFREDPLSVGSELFNTVLRVQEIIQKIVSSHPNRSDLNFCEENMRFGPGATTSISGVVTSGRKFNNMTLDCTEELVSFRAFCFPQQWGQRCTGLNVRRSSKLTTVPKNAKTDRVICIEPDLNIYVQLGIGATLRRRLMRSGLDLSSQEHNRYLASQAHLLELATVDLSSASDTLSKETVELLMPPAWVDLLGFARVPFTSVKGKEISLEKWSSMGNGYTFELETLIFYAIAKAVCTEDEWVNVLAYGDDIILPAKRVDSLERILSFLGFKVNNEKTFGKGRFYESCGADFFDGMNVRPFYFRSEHYDIDSVCYLYANNARRWANRHYGGNACDVRLLPVWLRCFAACQKRNRYLIPEAVGDVGFVVDFDNATPSRAHPEWGWCGWKYSFRGIVSERRVISEEGCLTAFLSGKRSEYTLARESIRGSFAPATEQVGITFEWPNLGPWLAVIA